jgi:signal transduction histidine kinase
MGGVRLRTKILLSLLLTSLGLTLASLLVVRYSVQKQVRAEIFQDLNNSVQAFENVQRQREESLSRSAALLADLPPLRALMTAGDAATIQDASTDFWRLSGSSLFVLADRGGRVMALHAATPGFTRMLAQDSLQRDAQAEEPNHWWFGGGHLYEIFIQPIYFGAPAQKNLLGILAVGYEIDESVARGIGRVAAGEVAFGYGRGPVVSTLSSSQRSELTAKWDAVGAITGVSLEDIELGKERYLRAAISLTPAASPHPVTLVVLKSYDQATAFLHRLNRLLLGLGLATLAAGGVIVIVISHTFTRPLKNLVGGVRSLEAGDYAYPLPGGGDDEVAEVTAAFIRMRQTLQHAQRQLLENEQLATIGRMASSISHDLRHSLTAVVANAEFLCESRLSRGEREELYREIRVAVNQMTDLIESLLEFSRTRESLRLAYGSLEDSVRRSADAVRAHPDFHHVNMETICEGGTGAWFDPVRIERVFHNLLLNACEAAPPENGLIRITIANDNDRFVIRVADNGHGIAETIRPHLFNPFVSQGKENGSGLGLTVVLKIIQDHGGEICVESTSPAGTVFQISLPKLGPSNGSQRGIPAAGLTPIVRTQM